MSLPITRSTIHTLDDLEDISFNESVAPMDLHWLPYFSHKEQQVVSKGFATYLHVAGISNLLPFLWLVSAGHGKRGIRR